MGAGVSPRTACPASVLRSPRGVAFPGSGLATLLPPSVRGHLLYGPRVPREEPPPPLKLRPLRIHPRLTPNPPKSISALSFSEKKAFVSLSRQVPGGRAGGRVQWSWELVLRAWVDLTSAPSGVPMAPRCGRSFIHAQ